MFTQAAIAASGDTGWGYCGVTQRSRAVIDQLAPQDGLYSVLVRSGADALPASLPRPETCSSPLTSRTG